MNPHFRCWDRDQAFRILNPDAEAIDDATFLAVHSERALEKMPSGKGLARDQADGIGSEISARDFLDQFLSLPDHAQAVVVGSAGTGKSHLIHWMRLNIPERHDRIVVNIPRSGTSLRGILQSLIDRLPEDDRAVYAARLAESGNDSDPKPVRLQRLTLNIGLALKGTAPRADDEIEDFLLPDRLPLLFMDPYLLPRLATPGGMIEALAEHIGASHQYNRQENVRSFEATDFSIVGVEADRLAEPTREVVAMLLGAPDVLDTATRLVNASVPRAIAAVLNFTGDQLIELLSDLRRHLAREQKEIVLLIEDLARIHGLDQAMLEALLIARSDNRPDLARLRWAMAVTKGFYNSRVPEPVQQRMHFEIDMDATARRGDTSREAEVVGFAAKYLNAVRIPGDQLRQWGELGGRGDPPNQCTPCRFRSECHAAFGEVDGIGLYPFSRLSLVRMLQRKDVDFPDRFNPRSLVGPVMNEVLGNRYSEFENGVFPSRSFRDGTGDIEIRPADLQFIRERTPADTTERVFAVVDLWGDQERGAPADVLATFGLSPLPTEGAVAPPPRPREPEVENKRSGDAVLEAIDAWGAGKRMPEHIGRTVRGYIFEALVACLEWDSLGLERDYFARSSGSPYFGERDISFVNQEVQADRRAIHLQIPHLDDPSSIANASMALKAIASLRRTGELPREPDARSYHLQMARHLELWSGQIVASLQEVVEPLGPQRANVQARLLLLGTALSGCQPATDADAEWVSAAFSEWSPAFVPPSAFWAATLDDLLSWRADTVRGYLATSAAMKGGEAKGTVNPLALVAALDDLRAAGWRVAKGDSPAVVSQGPLRDISQHLRTASVAVTDIVNEEWKRQSEWIVDLERSIPGETSVKEIKPMVLRLRSELAEGPVAVSHEPMTALLRALDVLDGDAVDQARRQIRQLGNFDTPPGLPELVHPVRLRAIAAWTDVDTRLRRVIKEVGSALEAVDRRVDVEEQMAADIETVRDRLGRISNALNELQA